MWESKLVLMVERLLEILTERRSQTFYNPIDASVTNAIEEIELSIIFLVVTIFCWWVVNKLRGTFS